MKIPHLLLLAPLFALSAFAADTPAPAASSSPAPAAAPAVPPATLADGEAVFKAMHYDTMLNQILEQQKRVVISMTRQITMRMNAPGTSPQELEAFQQKAVDTAWADIKTDEIYSDIARGFSEIFTRDQLQQIAAFYNTPAGQALSGKQMEIQQKIVEALRPRLMAVVPKIQQMAKDFAAEQQAKAKQAADAAAAAKPATQSASPAPAPATPPAPAASPKP